MAKMIFFDGEFFHKLRENEFLWKTLKYRKRINAKSPKLNSTSQ